MIRRRLAVALVAATTTIFEVSDLVPAGSADLSSGSSLSSL